MHSFRAGRILGYAALLVGTGMPISCKKASAPADVSVTVQAEHPTIAPISKEIEADAVLAPLAQAALAPRISSPIRAEYVQRGAHVHRGQLLLTLEDRDLQGAALDSKGTLSSAEASYASTTGATIPEDVQKAQLAVAEAKANLDVAKSTSDARRKLFEQGALPGRDADIAAAAAIQAQSAYDTATTHLAAVLKTTQTADMKMAQGQLDSAKGRYMNAQAQAGYANLVSPINGIVTDRPLFPGETAPAGTPVLTIMDTSSLLAKLHIAQADAQELKLGDKAEITVAGIDDPIEAKVSFLSPALDPGSTTVEVWLELPNAKGELRVGTSVHAVIRGTTVEKALQVPVAALLPGNDGAKLMIAGPDGLAHLRSVKAGIRTKQAVQIVEGLSPSDNVIVEGSYGLDDGTKVVVGSDAAHAEDSH